jgi:hypothetical protein
MKILSYFFIIIILPLLQHSKHSQASSHEDHPQRGSSHGVGEPVAVAFDARGGGDRRRGDPQRDSPARLPRQLGPRFRRRRRMQPARGVGVQVVYLKANVETRFPLEWKSWLKPVAFQAMDGSTEFNLYKPAVDCWSPPPPPPPQPLPPSSSSSSPVVELIISVMAARVVGVQERI